MDPNRHHGYIGHTEDRSVPVYYNKPNDDLITHSQMYSKVMPTNKKQCVCMNVSGNAMCNGCRNSAPENNWKMQNETNVDYRNKDNNNGLQESPMYIQSFHQQYNKGNDIPVNKQYWVQNNPTYSEELMLPNKKMIPTHLERKIPPTATNNNYALESTYHFDQQPQQQQQRRMMSETYCKDSCSYEDKYQIKDESCRNAKVGYIPLANTAYNIGNQSSVKIEASRTSIVDQQIVNPSNMLAAKDQQPSPNYARKCPQIFSNVEHNSCHSNLYVSPPQFSSEKFANVSSQKKPLQEYRAYDSNISHPIHIHSENIKRRDSPMQNSSPMMPYALSSQSNYPILNDQSPSQASQHLSYAVTAARNPNFYTPSISKVETPEMSPIIVKQTHSHHQYSKSPLPPPSHLMPRKNMPRITEDCLKKEADQFDLHGASNRNLFINPYNPPFKADDCCTEQSSLYTAKPPALSKDEPHSYHKFNKVALNPMSSSKPSSDIVNTPQQGYNSVFSRSSYYYENQSLRYENNAHNLSSPAVAATAASPLPATSQTHTQFHHTMYVKQPHHLQQMEQYQQQQPTELDRQTNKRHDISCTHSTGGIMEIHDHQHSKGRISSMHKIQQNVSTQPSPPMHTPQSTKKSQATKPNYRELINHVYAIRNSTSEEELNLQIIKKTLNVDAQGLRPHAVLVPGPTKVPSEKQPYNASIQYSADVAVRSTAFSVPTASLIPKITNTIQATVSQSKVDNILQEIKQEKTGSFSPLDLSMRTIKTKADSTEYSPKTFLVPSTNAQTTDSKYSLPRVDFTPNFSLHTNERAINSTRMQAQPDKRDQIIHLSSKLHVTADKAPQLFPHRKAIGSHMNSTSVNRFEQLIPETSQRQMTAGPVEMKNKSLSKGSGNLQVFQSRPSVLEANPYVNAKLHKESIHFSSKLSVVDQLPPDTSIMPLPKLPPQQVLSAINPLQPQSAYSLACERNPNFLGRKRHLHEYNTNAKFNEQPLNKQPRYQETKCVVLAEPPLMKVNEGKETEQQKATLKNSLQAAVSALNAFDTSPDIVVCKQEPVTPTNEIITKPPVAVKSETTSLIAARIRTKAELKGFTFNAMPTENVLLKEFKIKDEPVSNADLVELPCKPDMTDEHSQSSLLDFKWSTACNDFVEQLLTNSKKRTVRKRSQCATKLEKSIDDQPLASTVMTKSESVIVINECQKANEDSQDCSLSTVDSVLKNTVSKIEANDSAMTLKSISQDTTYMPNVVQKKISKLEREKIRLQQEKRIAARLRKDSSSESENEVNKRLTERLKKPLMRGKLRGAGAEKKRFSDCGSDSSTNMEENGTKSTKQISFEKITQKNENIDKSSNCEQVSTKTNVIIGNDEENPSEGKKLSHRTIALANKDVSSSKSEIQIMSTKLVSMPDSIKRQQECHANKKVQYVSVNNMDNNMYSKQIRNQKLHSKMIGLNTMTRSKRKRELELQLANSKVLRNDKIIRNSTTKIKRKYVRKFANSNKQVVATQDGSKKEQEQFVSTRLRPKSEKQLAKNHSNKLSNIKQSYNKKQHDSVSSKDQQTDLFLEVYRYKRALKVPASLISIKHPSNTRISSSLPDLEQNAEEQTPSSTHIPKISKKQISTAIKETPKHSSAKSYLSEEPKSIIDLLHSRVIKSSIRPKVKTAKVNASNSSIITHSETSQTTESNSIGLGELLPTPKKEDAEVENDGRKRHFSIFDTKVLQTKTRTESKLQQKKEIIREIFVGDDRPASAPPEMTQVVDGNEKMTYEQKYEQFLQQMNIVINEEKLRNFGRATTSITSAAMMGRPDSASASINKEQLDAAAEVTLDNDGKLDNVSSVSGPTSCFRRRRPAKYLRRKGSSGFDYIRKKKKPAPLTGNLTHISVKTERVDEYDCGKIKTETDVCREIQKWVLNKGVGQSTMHKAARLGYIDVIVYCLDRMGLNPDQKDNAGYTPLHEACTNGWLEIARILLQYGANHSEAAHSGIRPLHEASENDNVEIVRMLLSYGADPLLATYSGQTPLMLASSNSMKEILKEHLNDVQAVGTQRKPWRFDGPWNIFDEKESGYNIFSGAPLTSCDISKAFRKSNTISNKKVSRPLSGNSTQTATNSCAVLLDKIDHFNSVRLLCDNNKTDSKIAPTVDQSQFLIENSDSDGEMFEFEEADVLLPPLYLLKDEGMEKWVLLSDLCNLLKVKSKDTLLNKIYPSSSMSSSHKSLMRELKMSDFLEKATCLQLLCAGEKINVCASKVVLIKYNDNVRNLLGVKTILMKF